MGVVAGGSADHCEVRFADRSLPCGAGSSSAACCEAFRVADKSLPRGAGSASAARCEAVPVADQSLPCGAGASDSDLNLLRLRIENDMIDKIWKALMQLKSGGDLLKISNQRPEHWNDLLHDDDGVTTCSAGGPKTVGRHSSTNWPSLHPRMVLSGPRMTSAASHPQACQGGT